MQRAAVIGSSTRRRAIAVATVAAAAAAWSAPAADAATRYAKVHRACAPARPHRASCLALNLVPVAASARGAVPYVAGAGAYATGPAGGFTPGDLATAYGYAAATGGTGQTIGIVDAYDDPKLEEDLAVFDTHYGLAPCTTANGCLAKVSQTGSTTTLPPADEVGWSVETALDVETAHAVCPSCRILVVEAATESFADLAAAVDEAVSLGATEVSNSYGGLESDVGAPERAAYDHPGVVVTAASGDSGWDNWDFIAETGFAPEEPDAPAVLATVVSVGGTALKLNETATRKTEAVWNDSGRPSREEFKQFAATGSGCATSVTAPAWQQSLAAWASTGCSGKRLDNDIAAVGDPYTGFDIYDSYVYEEAFAPGWLTVGGTSLSSPLVAALYALAGGSHGASYPAHTLYGHLGQGAALYDVKTGGSGFCDGEAPAACGEPEINELLGEIDCVGTTACNGVAGFDGPAGVGAPRGLGAFALPLPVSVTKAATSLTASSAVLNATVNPKGNLVTGCAFEYGLTTAYGQTAPCSSLPGSGKTAVPVSASITGLAPVHTYHFRIAATNDFGASAGKDKTLKTTA